MRRAEEMGGWTMDDLVAAFPRACGHNIISTCKIPISIKFCPVYYLAVDCFIFCIDVGNWHLLLPTHIICFKIARKVTCLMGGIWYRKSAI